MSKSRLFPRILTIMSVSVLLFFTPQSGHCHLIKKSVGRANIGMVTYKVTSSMNLQDTSAYVQVQQQIRKRYHIQIYPSYAHVIANSPWADKLQLNMDEWISYQELKQLHQMPELSEDFKEIVRSLMINTLVGSAKCHMNDWSVACRSDASADQRRQYSLEKARYDLLMEIADNKDHTFTRTEIICLMEKIMAREMIALPIPPSVPYAFATIGMKASGRAAKHDLIH